MILPFTTHINGKPTFFVEKILMYLKQSIEHELRTHIEAQYEVEKRSYFSTTFYLKDNGHKNSATFYEQVGSLLKFGKIDSRFCMKKNDNPKR